MQSTANKNGMSISFGAQTGGPNIKFSEQKGYLIECGENNMGKAKWQSWGYGSFLTPEKAVEAYNKSIDTRGTPLPKEHVADDKKKDTFGFPITANSIKGHGCMEEKEDVRRSLAKIVLLDSKKEGGPFNFDSSSLGFVMPDGSILAKTPGSKLRAAAPAAAAAAGVKRKTPMVPKRVPAPAPAPAPAPRPARQAATDDAPLEAAYTIDYTTLMAPQVAYGAPNSPYEAFRGTPTHALDKDADQWVLDRHLRPGFVHGQAVTCEWVIDKYKLCSKPAGFPVDLNWPEMTFAERLSLIQMQREWAATKFKEETDLGHKRYNGRAVEKVGPRYPGDATVTASGGKNACSEQNAVNIEAGLPLAYMLRILDFPPNMLLDANYRGPPGVPNNTPVGATRGYHPPSGDPKNGKFTQRYSRTHYDNPLDDGTKTQLTVSVLRGNGEMLGFCIVGMVASPPTTPTCYIHAICAKQMGSVLLDFCTGRLAVRDPWTQVGVRQKQTGYLLHPTIAFEMHLTAINYIWANEKEKKTVCRPETHDSDTSGYFALNQFYRLHGFNNAPTCGGRAKYNVNEAKMVYCD